MTTGPVATAAQCQCLHEDFSVVVEVNRTVDTGRFVAEIQIACKTCDLPFTFLGVRAGLSWHEPTCSIDSTVLNAPITPEYLRSLHQRASYAVPPELTQRIKES